MTFLRTAARLAAALGMFVAFGGTAHALVVTNVSNAPTSWATAMAATPNTLATPGTWATTPAIRTGNLTNVYRSPFDNQDLAGNPDNSAYIRNSYWAVSPGNGVNPAIMTFGSDQATLSFLWGSVDGYNKVELYDNGSLVATILNTDITPAAGNPVGRGASYVTISGAVFDEIRFSSSSNAFEFSNMSTTAVPLPAAAWLLLSGLAGLGLVSRRRKA